MKPFSSEEHEQFIVAQLEKKLLLELQRLGFQKSNQIKSNQINQSKIIFSFF